VVADTHRNLCAQPMRPLLEAQWPCYVPRAGRLGVPAMTLAAGADRLIPVEAVERTARHHGARHRTLQGVGHALMLDDGWEAGAHALGDWLEGIA
jgi:pimeloyl-ACP methyl ester carboxylesterase